MRLEETVDRLNSALETLTTRGNAGHLSRRNRSHSQSRLVSLETRLSKRAGIIVTFVNEPFAALCAVRGRETHHPVVNGGMRPRLKPPVLISVIDRITGTCQHVGTVAEVSIVPAPPRDRERGKYIRPLCMQGTTLRSHRTARGQ